MCGKMESCKLRLHPLLLLHVIVVFHTLHAVKFDDENEGAIKHRCHPQIGSCFPSQLEWARLETKMTGKLVWPDDSFNYTTYNFQYNLMSLTYPIVHVVCKTVEDIQNAVRFAKKHNLRVTIKSHGNEFWGRSSAHGSFSINLMEMKQINVNTAATERSMHGEVIVQTGATFGEIYTEVEKHDRVVVGGNSHLAGPAGLISGGGYSVLSPHLGLVADNVLEIKVVLADGRVASCSENKTIIENNGLSETHNNGDLFWALRGGGGGTFGIVVHYMLKLHPAPISVVKAFIRVPLHQNNSDVPLAKMFLEASGQWMRTAPSYWGGTIVFHSNILYAALTKYGPIDENTKSDLQQFYDLQDHYLAQSLITYNFVNYSTIGASIVQEPTAIRGYTSGALIPFDNHNESLWDFLVHEAVENRNLPAPCMFSRLGGKIWEYNKAWSSVSAGFRRAQSHFMCPFLAPTDYEIGTIEAQERQKMNAARFSEKIRKFGDGGYLNVDYLPSQDWKVDFWGEHYVDLLKVKIKYDPDNLFYCYHCVGSDMKYGDQLESSGVSTSVTGHVPAVLLLVLAIFMNYM